MTGIYGRSAPIPADPKISDIESGYYDGVLNELTRAVADPVYRMIDNSQESGRSELLASEQRRYDEAVKVLNVIGVRRKVAEREFHNQRAESERREEESAAVRRQFPGVFGSPMGRYESEDAQAAQMRAFLDGSGPNTLRIPMAAAMRNRELERKGLRSPELRNTLVGDDGAGTLVVPTLVANTIFDTLEAEIAAFRLPTTRLNTPTGADILYPTIATHGIGTQVIAQGTAIGGTDPVIGSKTLTAFKYGQLLQLSSEIIQDSSIDILAMVARDAARALGRVIDTDLVVGSGVGEPEGVMTAISGAGTIHGSTAGITYEQLVDLQYSVNSGYRATGSAAWLMRDLTAGTIRKLRDGAGGTVGSPLWRSNESTGGVANYAPPTLLGDMAFTDPNVASVASTKKVVVYGDWSSYFLRTVGDLIFERDDSFAFDKDLSTFRAKWRVDGRVMDTAAFNILRTV